MIKERDEESERAKPNHDDLMETYNKNISDVYKKLKKISGDKVNSIDIPEINTFLGCYTGSNVLEGFRVNTQILCNEKEGKNFSEEFLKRCNEDLIIINEIAKDEDLVIPPMTLEKIKEIVHKKLKKNKACDLYQITPEHLKHAGDATLELFCVLARAVYKQSSEKS